jgi:hypothetical protein
MLSSGRFYEKAGRPAKTLRVAQVISKGVKKENPRLLSAWLPCLPLAAVPGVRVDQVFQIVRHNRLIRIHWQPPFFIQFHCIAYPESEGFARSTTDKSYKLQ